MMNQISLKMTHMEELENMLGFIFKKVRENFQIPSFLNLQQEEDTM